MASVVCANHFEAKDIPSICVSSQDLVTETIIRYMRCNRDICRFKGTTLTLIDDKHQCVQFCHVLPGIHHMPSIFMIKVSHKHKELLSMFCFDIVNDRLEGDRLTERSGIVEIWRTHLSASCCAINIQFQPKRLMDSSHIQSFLLQLIQNHLR